MSGRLSDKVALITGAGSGIGFACARRFAEEGATIVGLDLNAGEQWHEIEAMGGKTLFMEGDVTSLERQQAVVARAVDMFGSLDVLVTSAGIGDAGPVHMVEEAAWQRVIDINLSGTFLSAKAVLPQMMQQRSGSIVTIASCEGVVATEGGSSYNASRRVWLTSVRISQLIMAVWVSAAMRCARVLSKHPCSTTC